MINTQSLTDTTRGLVASNKGLLAMDESNPTCNKRFANIKTHPMTTSIDPEKLAKLPLEEL